MGGKPSQGTKRDGRLKGNKGRGGGSSSSTPSSAKRGTSTSTTTPRRTGATAKK